MKKFAENFDLIIVTRSLAYPQSNRLAEAAIKIAKKVFNVLQLAGTSMDY